MKIIFDFDHTLLNTTLLHHDLVKSMVRQGIDKEQYFDAYNTVTRWKVFTVDDIARHLEQNYNVATDDVAKVFNDIALQSKHYLYDDVHSGCEELKKDGHILYLLSWGDDHWQQNKIEHSGICPHFEEHLAIAQVVEEGSLGKWIKDSECVVLVNDKPAELRAIQTSHPNYHLFRMKRSNGKYSDQLTPPGIKEVEDMKGLLQAVRVIV